MMQTLKKNNLNLHFPENEMLIGSGDPKGDPRSDPEGIHPANIIYILYNKLSSSNKKRFEAMLTADISPMSKRGATHGKKGATHGDSNKEQHSVMAKKKVRKKKRRKGRKHNQRHAGHGKSKMGGANNINRKGRKNNQRHGGNIGPRKTLC
eukprot:66489_1